MRFVASLSLLLCGGVLLGACTEPVPPSASGAYKVAFTFVSGCMQKAHEGTVGVVTDAKKTTVVVDGVEGATVACSVAGAGTGPYSVTGEIVQGSNALNFTIPAISKTATEAMPAEGSVSYRSVITADTYSSAQMPACQFYFKSGTPETVDPGKIWVAFRCDKVLALPSECALGESYILLENCDG